MVEILYFYLKYAHCASLLMGDDVCFNRFNGLCLVVDIMLRLEEMSKILKAFSKMISLISVLKNSE